jgi:hypothetical protein
MKYSFLYSQNSEVVTILPANKNMKTYSNMQELLFDAETLTNTDISFYSMKLTASDGNYTQTSELKNFTGVELDQLIESFESDMKAFGLKTSKIELV